ncbi:MAG: hypothetical protein QG574_2485 [Cyanobacteriota bacterium erpe_2018_sw_21hr_WHONDRS-SW48-000092_B_bin.40]|jgi:prevent-host-death family protein|nr:hypothetical protein [Cyanobacteriota bacterium erpe_2018_sw_21hr_WHONDRS-SW48-000092_B_bin.40]
MAKEKTIGAGEFKTHCLNLIDEVNRSRLPIIITKHGKPLARLVPYADEPYTLFGCMKGSVVVHGDLVDGTGEEWQADGD